VPDARQNSITHSRTRKREAILSAFLVTDGLPASSARDPADVRERPMRERPMRERPILATAFADKPLREMGEPRFKRALDKLPRYVG
jgi:hypothetical protein